MRSLAKSIHFYSRQILSWGISKDPSPISSRNRLVLDQAKHTILVSPLILRSPASSRVSGLQWSRLGIITLPTLAKKELLKLNNTLLQSVYSPWETLFQTQV